MAKNFTFKQFHINAFQCGMPVSTDAILLGAWATIDSAKSILDIGCGTGLLAIMCAQRNQTALIEAIEIEEHAFNAATNNCLNSPWSSRLSVNHISLQDFVVSKNKFDTIICNPPYFTTGKESISSQRAVARHTTTLSHETLLISCQQLLNHNGTASFVLPKKEGLAFVDLLDNLPNEESTFALSRLTYVKTTINKPATRVLIELTHFIKSPSMQLKPLIDQIQTASNQLIIHTGQGYSTQFIELTNQFYLKM